MIDFDGEITKIKEAKLFRSLRTSDGITGKYIFFNGNKYLNFSGNDYLGFSQDEYVKDALIEGVKLYGTGSTGSRYLSGCHKIHRDFELKIAEFKGFEDALLFPAGYLANIGVISALVNRSGCIIMDKLNHASIVDGAFLSNAKILVYPHLDIEYLKKLLKVSSKYESILVVSDSVFSMDGDIFPLDRIYESFPPHAVLYLDDAHSTFVTGRGIFDMFCLKPASNMLTLTTLSKAFGLFGGVVSGSSSVIEFLRNRAKTQVYSTALPPYISYAAIKCIELFEKEGFYRVKKIRQLSGYFRSILMQAGFEVLGCETIPIIPVLIGELEKALRLEKFLFENGVFAPAIRPPTVPKNKCRIRFSINWFFEKSDLEYVVDILIKCNAAKT